jgi:hypothetical protein
VLDYKITQLGHQGSHDGMILVDGTWYCSGMPETLVNATLDFRKGLIDETTYRARIEERRGHQIRPRARADADGHIRMRCPASKPAPVVRCELKPGSEGPAATAKIRIPVTDILRVHRPKVCTQESVTLPAEAVAKYFQPLPHATPEWQAMYSTLRNSVEGMNGFIKDGAREAIDDPERRRIRGVAPQSVLVAFQLFAANLRKIDEFLTKRAAEAKKVRTRPSRRRTQSLVTWAPESAATTDGGDATGDPDPPLTA